MVVVQRLMLLGDGIVSLSRSWSGCPWATVNLVNVISLRVLIYVSKCSSVMTFEPERWGHCHLARYLKRKGARGRSPRGAENVSFEIQARGIVKHYSHVWEVSIQNFRLLLVGLRCTTSSYIEGFWS